MPLSKKRNITPENYAAAAKAGRRYNDIELYLPKLKIEVVIS